MRWHDIAYAFFAVHSRSQNAQLGYRAANAPMLAVLDLAPGKVRLGARIAALAILGASARPLACIWHGTMMRTTDRLVNARRATVDTRP